MHHNTLRKQLDREIRGCKEDTRQGACVAKRNSESRARPLIPLRQGSSAALLRAPPANCTMSALTLLLAPLPQDNLTRHVAPSSSSLQNCPEKASASKYDLTGLLMW